MGIVLDRVFTLALPQYRRQLHRYAQWLVWVLGTILIFSVLGLDVNLFLIIITLVGIGLLLSTQELLRNLAAKAALDVNPPFKVGDTIGVVGHSGRVVQTNYLTTVLLDDHGKLVHIPNSTFLREPTTNFSSEAGNRIDLVITLDRKKGLDALKKAIDALMERIGDQLVEDYPPRIEVLRITRESIEVAVLLRVSNPGKSSSVKSEAYQFLIENL